MWSAMRMLFGLIKKDSPLNVENKLTIYKVFLRPILTYNIQVWHTACKTQMNKIQVMQNKNLRKAFNVWHDPITHRTIRNSDLHIKPQNINTIKEDAKYLIVKTFEKMKFHPNDLIKNLTIIDSSSLPQSSPFCSLFN
jgi:hypothetical protein